jgi:L-methionine (R)-S-oxide reductase
MSEEISIPSEAGKQERYEMLMPQLTALVEGEPDTIANLANLVAAFKSAFNFFWIGVYFVKEKDGKEELVLGPFQGPVACTRIGFGKGVCGTSWKERKTIIVPDVDQFPGHIACSSKTKSEIVVPILRDNKVIAVLDIDSKYPDDFDNTDALYLEQAAKWIVNLI